LAEARFGNLALAYQEETRIAAKQFVLQQGVI
jgi:hypothetical protein